MRASEWRVLALRLGMWDTIGCWLVSWNAKFGVNALQLFTIVTNRMQVALLDIHINLSLQAKNKALEVSKDFN